MSNPITVYITWFGQTVASQLNTSVTNVASLIGGTPYWAITSKYYQGSSYVSQSVTLGGSSYMPAAYGFNLSSEFNTVIKPQLDSGALPVSYDAIYVIVISGDVTTAEFCSSACGYHSFAPYNGTNLKWILVGDASLQCPSQCSYQGKCLMSGSDPLSHAL